MSNVATDDDGRREERAVWLTDRELERLEAQAESLRDRLVVNLGARCGLRISETVGLTVADLDEAPADGKLRYWATVRGKDTRADTDGKKERKTWVPKDVYRDLRLQVQQENLAGDDPLLPSREEGHLAAQSGRRIVKQLARAAADATGSERFLDVSSHDLRRFWANYLLVEEGVNPRVVMRLGGWEDFQSIKPYLDRPRDSTVADEMVTAGWV
jgi:integrase